MARMSWTPVTRPFLHLGLILFPPAAQRTFFRQLKVPGRVFATVTQVTHYPFDLFHHIVLKGKQEWGQASKSLTTVCTAESPHTDPPVRSLCPGDTSTVPCL